MTHTTIFPELGQKTNATIQYTVSAVRRRSYYVITDEFLEGRGIKMTSDGSDHARGKKSYLVTEKALAYLKAKFDTCYITTL